MNSPGSKLSRQSREDVQQALYLLAATRKGEIPYQPNYGLSLIYGAIGDYTTETDEIEREMSLAIAEFEPRIAAVSVTASKIANVSGRSLRLEIAYNFQTQSQLFTTNFPIG